MKNSFLFLTVLLLMSMMVLSCTKKRITPILVYYEFHNDTERIIEIKNHWGNGQIDYYKINPNEYMFLEKYNNEPGGAKEKPDNYIDHVPFD